MRSANAKGDLEQFLQQEGLPFVYFGHVCSAELQGACLDVVEKRFVTPHQFVPCLGGGVHIEPENKMQITTSGKELKFDNELVVCPSET